MSSLTPAGVSSFHSWGGGRRRARGELRAARLRFVHCGLRTRAGPRRPRPSGRLREGPAARPPAEAHSTPRPWLRPLLGGRETSSRCGHGCWRSSPGLAPPLAGRGRRGRGAAPPSPPRRRRAAILPSCLRRLRRVFSQAARGSHRRLSARSPPAATPPPSRASASRRRAGKEPLIFGVSPARRAARPRPGCRSPHLGAEVAARSCRAVAPRPGAWRASQTGSRLAAQEAAGSLTAEPCHLPGASPRRPPSAWPPRASGSVGSRRRGLGPGLGRERPWGPRGAWVSCSLATRGRGPQG